MSHNQKIDSLLHEERRFPPSAEFVANAIGTQALYDEAKADRLGFWAKQSRELLHWHRPFHPGFRLVQPTFCHVV